MRYCSSQDIGEGIFWRNENSMTTTYAIEFSVPEIMVAARVDREKIQRKVLGQEGGK